MEDKERKAEAAERLTETFSDWLDGVSEEAFSLEAAEDWLTQAEALDPMEPPFDAAAAEAAFRARHGEAFPASARRENRGRRRPRCFLLRAGGIAAAAALVAALAAQSLGVDLFRHTASWTRGEFTFTTGADAGGESGAVSYSDGQAALDAYGVEEPMIPTWNPAWEGEDVPGLEVTVTEEDGTVTFTEDHRTSDGRGYTFVVRQRENAWQAEEDIESGAETIRYDFDGRSYYMISTGPGQYRITWSVGRYSGEIYGDMDLKTAKHFVRSITKPDEWVYQAPDMSVPPKYGTIQEAMEAAGIETDYAPAWLPEGFEPVESDIYVSEDVGWYSAYLFSTDVEGRRNLSLSFDLSTNPDGAGKTVYPKDDTPIVTFEKGGVTFYIISNGPWRSVAWMDGGMAGSIGGNLTEEECRQMVDSIPRYAS